MAQGSGSRLCLGLRALRNPVFSKPMFRLVRAIKISGFLLKDAQDGHAINGQGQYGIGGGEPEEKGQTGGGTTVH